ncbi:uncharacterized protein [Palaemon carinicauda]|uniref:uncharacterized protein n=1 Tax=Palaemon carinicauda TaxID=392227 RepID=UPI0035B5F92B
MDRGWRTRGTASWAIRIAAKELKDDSNITVSKPDKIAAFFLIATRNCHEKLDTILTDTSKFKRLTANPIQDIKQEANRAINAINTISSAMHFKPITGEFGLGNVKTHSSLPPIISQCPEPTYQLTKRLNSLLIPYLPYWYSVGSSMHFLTTVKGHFRESVINSLDVESLFTNVPVNVTIKLILDRVYRDDSTPPLNISKLALHTLLEICTKKALSSIHHGHMYIQKDDVAIGSPLDLLFPNFYRGVFKEHVFARVDRANLYMAATSMTPS